MQYNMGKKSKGKGKKGKTKHENGTPSSTLTEEQMARVIEDHGSMEALQSLICESAEKAKAAAEKRTEDPLMNWTRPEREECPVCMLPLPSLQTSESMYWCCCGRIMCCGCIVGQILAKDDNDNYANNVDKAFLCPFCRVSNSSGEAEHTLEKEMKRANEGNSEAIFRVGQVYYHGERGIKQDKDEGLKWFHRAMKEGSGRAAYILGVAYEHGDGVDKDIDKAIEYYQKGGDLGDAHSFHSAGILLVKKGMLEEAALHYRKAAMCGLSDNNILDYIRHEYKAGIITKEEYAYTLREHQAACNEMKSEGRDAYKQYLVDCPEEDHD